MSTPTPGNELVLMNASLNARVQLKFYRFGTENYKKFYREMTKSASDTLMRFYNDPSKLEKMHESPVTETSPAHYVVCDDLHSALHKNSVYGFLVEDFMPVAYSWTRPKRQPDVSEYVAQLCQIISKNPKTNTGFEREAPHGLPLPRVFGVPASNVGAEPAIKGFKSEKLHILPLQELPFFLMHMRPRWRSVNNIHAICHGYLMKLQQHYSNVKYNAFLQSTLMQFHANITAMADAYFAQNITFSSESDVEYLKMTTVQHIVATRALEKQQTAIQRALTKAKANADEILAQNKLILRGVAYAKRVLKNDADVERLVRLLEKIDSNPRLVELLEGNSATSGDTEADREENVSMNTSLVPENILDHLVAEYEKTKGAAKDSLKRKRVSSGGATASKKRRVIQLKPKIAPEIPEESSGSDVVSNMTEELSESSSEPFPSSDESDE